MSSPYPRHRPVSAAEAVAADREAIETYRVPSSVLLEHAGRGLATLVADLLPRGASVAVLCGPGNNGGDGYACARFLLGWGAPVRLVRCAAAPPAGPDAALEHDLARRETEVLVAASATDAPVLARALDDAGVIVDALFGVGLSRPLASPFPEWIGHVNAASGLRVSADLPSGLDADAGTPLPVAVRAHVTAAMGFAKRGCFTAPGAAYAGRVVEIDVGLPGAVHRPYLA